MDLASNRLALQVASGDTLDVRRFTVSEQMSQLFDVSLVAMCANENLDFDAIVGQKATFGLTEAGGERKWVGVVSELSQVQTEGSETGLSTYHLRIVPSLWFTTQRRNHRMFQQLSDLEIAEKLLAEWEIKVKKQLTGTYKKRKYRVQYAESDFAFINRMLEDAGITYYFVEQDGECVMVLSDAPQKNEPRELPLPFRDSGSDLPGSFATRVRVAQKVRPGKYTVRDHDYRLQPSYNLAKSADGKRVPIEEKLERFHYNPGAFLFRAEKGDETPNADDKGKSRSDEKEAELIAKKRLDAKRSDAKVVQFDTGATDLQTGTVFRFMDHPRADLGSDKPWLVVSSLFSGAHDTDWTHHCEARGAESDYRPPIVTPKPKVSGIESATVVGPAGEEIHTDEFGRIRVHFHWDRESKMDDNSSCWIHVNQPWSGSAYGGVNLPRIGQEVIVDFLGGDPDRPVITGRVYTNLQKVPYKLPQHKTRSAWKSDSSPGSGGFNEIMFEDLKGRELVWQQAEKNQRRLVKNDEVITIGNDRAKLVKANETETTVANRTEVTNQNRHEITDQNRLVKIGQMLSKLVGGNEIRRTNGNRQRMVDQNEDMVVGQTRKERVGGDSHSSVGGMLNQMIGAARSLIVQADDQKQVGGKSALEAGKEIHLKSGQLFVLEAGARLSIKGPGGFIDFHSGGIDIVGNLVRINSGGSPADGSGSAPTPPLPAAEAQPADPPRPVMDDVSKTGIAQ
ncbi:MAG: type VI secretion system tip protein VgrG [Polyangiaceae bacterium]|nr:type VI secretion system tip protein VgrG [Polyangiaceae bacterium]